MQFSVNELRRLVHIPNIDNQTLAERLTMAGLEIDGMRSYAPYFSGVVVAKILSIAPHPNADRLRLCQVDVGQDEPLPIVCGAANAAMGLIVPCAMVGAKLPEITIKEARVRGETSLGMLCSAQELGMEESAHGLWVLPNHVQIGQDLRQALDLDDIIFTLKITPNRADCLSLVGLAREVAALFSAPLTLPTITPPASTLLRPNLAVNIHAPSACTVYCAQLLSNLDNGAQCPYWLLESLKRSGMRSINPIVDVTNYVMLLWGQPMHAFDATQLSGEEIKVRYAQAQETLTLLNGQCVQLQETDLLIADADKAVALAGVMGGMDTAVHQHTQHVLLESAVFIPEVIANTSRRLHIQSDAAYRFERGVDMTMTAMAMAYASQLIQEICGGHASAICEVKDAMNLAPIAIAIDLSYINNLLGTALSLSEVVAILKRLNFSVDDQSLQAIPPSYRFDVTIAADLAEEIARVYGYEHIPPRLPMGISRMVLAQDAKDVVQDKLVACGYQELVSLSFADGSIHDGAGADTQQYPADYGIRIANPIASHLAMLRTDLCGNLLQALRYNIHRQQERAMLFEIATVYHKSSAAAQSTHYQEMLRVAAIVYGQTSAPHWADNKREWDFFDIKAHVLMLCAYAEELIFLRPADVPKGSHRFSSVQALLHPTQSAFIQHGDSIVGCLGRLHPQWQHEFSHAVYWFELDMSLCQIQSAPHYQAVSKFLPIQRDLAVVLDEDCLAGDVILAIQHAKIPYVVSVDLFDVYKGDGIQSGKKSLALSIVMQDMQANLTDEIAHHTVASVLTVLHTQFSAKLRDQ